MESSSSSSNSSSGSNSYADYDDAVARTIRGFLKERRGLIIQYLAEKLVQAFLNSLMEAMVLSPVEADQVKRKQRRQQKAQCLVDIISRKRGTELKVFVDLLENHCPKAYNLLHVRDPGLTISAENIRQGVGGISLESNESHPSHRSSDSGGSLAMAASKPQRPVHVSAIEQNLQLAAARLKDCMTNNHHGVPVFYKELMAIRRSGIDLALVTFDGSLSLMHVIIKLDRVDFLKVIQYAGLWNAFINLRTADENRLLPIDLAVKLKRHKIVHALRDLGTIEENMHDIERCVREGNILKFRQIRDKHRNYIMQSSGNDISILDYACQSGELTMVIEVIQMEQEFRYQRMSVNKPMALSVDLGHHSLLRTLKEYMAVDFNRVIVEGKSLTERAAFNGDIETFRELERLGAVPADTIVALSAAQNRLPFLQELLSGHQPFPYNLNFQDRRRKSAAHFAAEKGYLDVVRLLLEKGLDINLRDKRDFTVLHSAASGGSVGTIEVVLDFAERQHVQHRLLNSRDRYLGSERCFLVRGRDNDQPAWHYVEADRGRIDIFRKRTQGGPVDVANYGIVRRSGWGNNPSQETIQEIEGLYDVVNANPNGPYDMQPLHVAIIKSHEQAALKLISVMDDVGHPDHFGLTPLHLAAMRGHVKVIKALLAKGANRTITDEQGRTALDIAKANEKAEAAAVLIPCDSEEDETELFRRKLLDAYHSLSKEKRSEAREEGSDPKKYTKDILRNIVADVNDFLFDSLGEGPIATESGQASMTESQMYHM